jgi:hypothetical protein
MDMVPLIDEVEERFAVTFPEHADTVGELYLSLLGQTRRRARAPCATSPAFYRIRRTLTAEFAMDRRRVRPAARLHDLFPAESRDAAWPRLAAALGLPDLPDLPRRRVPSARVFRILWAGVSAGWWLVCPLLGLVTGEDFSLAYGLAVWLLLTLLVWQWFGLLWLTGTLRYLERVRVPRVRHLVVRLVRQQSDESAGGQPVPGTLWRDLTAIIAGQTGVPAQEVQPEHHFGELPDYC